ncbi:hypothetical protein CFC21_041768 [Triticum aestivum]|uniref:Uncharacterized protein n=4 Tax=Triticum TaxID=4564 RepID=A0A077RWI2_WHEAT|nr:hypothetical protein CFC21_039993 [Triticum aestivum]VAH72968.1 unnamed protein product [Triticum turgidum subsp. durum]KAF7030169.1 hypothetical protein CFC21_041768 [Triticum aestivum]CDM81410.1 unnamed protein product [Triticum aestivum]CDM83753.1 unnamed protein product [Triticum aestivum]
MLDPGKPAFTPKKGKPSVVMFVGLQEEEKTMQVLGVGCGNSRLEDNLLWWGVAAAGGTCIDRLAGNEEMLP